jgi:chromosome segregation ATPase
LFALREIKFIEKERDLSKLVEESNVQLAAVKDSLAQREKQLSCLGNEAITLRGSNEELKQNNIAANTRLDDAHQEVQRLRAQIETMERWAKCEIRRLEEANSELLEQGRRLYIEASENIAQLKAKICYAPGK